jgi:glutathione S-transferase
MTCGELSRDGAKGDDAMAHEIILHHYDVSPFSEKVRILLGIKGLSWRSVIQPVIMPKPDLTPLTGGYRRIPVMQVGADIYCDTQVIMAEIERRAPSPRVIQGADWAVNLWADRLLFQPAVAIIFGAIGHTVGQDFIADREQLSGRPFDLAAMKAAGPPMKGQFRAMAAWLDQQLAGGDQWLSGAAAGLADIAAYMNFWFIERSLAAEMAQLLAGLSHVPAWKDRVAALGHGARSEMTTAEAIAIAAASEPAADIAHDPADPLGAAPGDAVVVMADDYGRDRIEGRLVAANPERIVIAREDPRVGAVNVHFPRAGYVALAA